MNMTMKKPEGTCPEQADPERVEGFTFIELILSLLIIATLTAIALPSLTLTAEEAYGAKSLDNIHNIGTALLVTYHSVANQGDKSATGAPVTNGAIATFNENLSAGPLSLSDTVIIYGDGSKVITWRELFPNGLPISPFNDEPYEYAESPGEGQAVWVMKGGTPSLEIGEKPSITVHDPLNTSIVYTFTP